jgi:large subunit ribosomal protein L10
MRQEKQLLLDEVREQLEKFNSFVILSYSKLSANSANDFRRIIAKNGGSLEVVRKRVLIKAAEAAGVKLDLSTLPGHIGLVFAGPDALETTKLVFKFRQDVPNTVEVVGGKVDGLMYSGADIETLSNLPSKDEMRAQFLGTLEAPLSQTLAVMEAILTSVVYCLDNKSKQEGSDQ